ILGPFPDVAEHVVQAITVGLEAADRRGAHLAILAVVHGPAGELIPGRAVGDVGELAGTRRVLAPIARRRHAGPRGVLPFRLGRQAVAFAGLAPEPGDVGGGVVPAGAHDRVAVGLCEAGIPPVALRILDPLAAIVDGAAALHGVAGLGDKL